jgi:hypothetical protein
VTDTNSRRQPPRTNDDDAAADHLHIPHRCLTARQVNDLLDTEEDMIDLYSFSHYRNAFL